LEFDEAALELFVLLTGGDTRQIDNELEKIDVYCSTGFQPVGPAGVPPAEFKKAGKMPTGPTAKMAVPRISVELVRELVPLSRAGVIFELSNALSARDLELALTLVRRLLEQGEKAVGILLAAIVPTIRNLLLAKDLMEQHGIQRSHSPFQFIASMNRLPTKATEHLPRKKDGSINAYGLAIAAQHANQFDSSKLVEAMRACLDANVKLVTTQLDHELILTEVIIKLLRETQGD
jgi:DNA polymerase-3 subunit delta